MVNPDHETALSLWCSKQPRPDPGHRLDPKHRIVVDARDSIDWDERPCPAPDCDGVIRRCSAPASDLTQFPPMRQPSQ